MQALLQRNSNVYVMSSYTCTKVAVTHYIVCIKAPTSCTVWGIFASGSAHSHLVVLSGWQWAYWAWYTWLPKKSVSGCQPCVRQWNKS